MTKIKTIDNELVLPLKSISKKAGLKEGDKIKISIIKEKNKKHLLIEKNE